MRRKFLVVLLVLASAFNVSYAAEQIKEEDSMKWWQNTIVYQIYPKTFRDVEGNKGLRAITNTLDYLRDLGVGAIWITPFYPSPMVDNGYDISDYTGIDEQYGSMKDFEELIAEADKRGIKIVMDLVFNHSSDQHKWYGETLKRTGAFLQTGAAFSAGVYGLGTRTGSNIIFTHSRVNNPT